VGEDKENEDLNIGQHLLYLWGSLI